MASDKPPVFFYQDYRKVSSNIERFFGGLRSFRLIQIDEERLASTYFGFVCSVRLHSDTNESFQMSSVLDEFKSLEAIVDCTVAALTLDDLRNRIKEIDDPEQASGLRIFINLAEKLPPDFDMLGAYGKTIDTTGVKAIAKAKTFEDIQKALRAKYDVKIEDR